MSDFQYDVKTAYTFESASFDGNTETSVLNPTFATPSEIESIQTARLVAGETSISLYLGTVYASKLPNGKKDEIEIDANGNVTAHVKTNTLVFNSLDFFGDSESSLTQKLGFEIPSNAAAVSTLVDSQSALCSVATAGNSLDDPNKFIVNTSLPVPTLVVSENFLFANETEADAYLAENPVTLIYELETPVTVELGQIDVSSLQKLDVQIPITFETNIETVSTYSYASEKYVNNKFEDYNAPEYAFPPNHMGQEWETFDANNWNKKEMLDYTGQMESHAVYTVELCELMQSGTFDWSRPELDWSEAEYDQEQFDRFCKYFEARFMFREISMLPPLHWFTAFRRMMVYELMPKYKPLYAQIESGLAPLGANEYYKERHVSSAYPETMLSGNSDYISSGEDKEWERVKVDNAAEALEAYRNGFRSVDAALGDELEVLFISMYTSYVNGL